MGSEVDYYLCFTATLRSSSLALPSLYSDYQQFLHDTTVEFREKGWTFNQIAEWFNENGYQTVKGKKFFGNSRFLDYQKETIEG